MSMLLQQQGAGAMDGMFGAGAMSARGSLGLGVVPNGDMSMARSPPPQVTAKASSATPNKDKAKEAVKEEASSEKNEENDEVKKKEDEQKSLEEQMKKLQEQIEKSKKEAEELKKAKGDSKSDDEASGEKRKADDSAEDDDAKKAKTDSK
ncbi:MAG: hypothetical protein SGARI_001567 [Bacillariaceae sp.]